MGFAFCIINLNLVMESGTRKGRKALQEPSQFHDLFRLWGCEDGKGKKGSRHGQSCG